MTGDAIVAELKQLTPIVGADRIVQSTIFGETVIVSKDFKEGDLGVLFDCETQLSVEFCHANNLFKRAESNSDQTKTGYFGEDRRVRPIRLKGVKCSGLWMPIESLEFTLSHSALPLTGTQLTEWDNVKICNKYVSPQNQRSLNSNNKEGKAKVTVPSFKEHIDTAQFMRNTHLLEEGVSIIVTEKLHGTSARVGYLAVEQKSKTWLTKLITLLCDTFIFKSHGSKHLSYQTVIGSRRVVKSIGEGDGEKKDSFYKSNIWAETAPQFNLRKGETVYYEIVGYLPDGGSIMHGKSNAVLKPFMSKPEYSAFIERYGDTTDFNYGCNNKYFDGVEGVKAQHKVFVYRITTTNDDNESVDYSWGQVKMRCEQMGVEHVPELGRYRVGTDSAEAIIHAIETEAEQPSKLFPSHLREGVCIRIDGASMVPKILKQKAYLFKVLEGIIKETKSDLEEEQG